MHPNGWESIPFKLFQVFVISNSNKQFNKFKQKIDLTWKLINFGKKNFSPHKGHNVFYYFPQEDN